MTRAGEPVRRRLPDERQGYVRKFRCGTTGGYFAVGLYPDGSPGELFIFVDGAGSSLRGLLDAVAIDVSLMLQYGIPLAVVAAKHIGRAFDPAGMTGDPVRPVGKSVLDVVMSLLTHRHAPEACPCRAHVEERERAQQVAP